MSINRDLTKGFTLMELCLALAVLTLLSASIHSVLRGSIDTAAVLTESQNRRQQVDGFVDLCTRTFHRLPGRVRMETHIREQNGTAYPDIVIRNAPQLLSWGQVEDLEAMSVLGLQPQTGGRYSLALLRIHPGRDPLVDPISKAKPEEWLPLISDVTSLTWRFFDATTNEWQPILPPGKARPRAVEMVLVLADEPNPVRAVFEIIPLASRPKPRTQEGVKNNP